MAQALSDDLRRRVVTAVMEGGMSRRAAAQRFGIAPSTAIKWVDAWRRTGSYRPRRQGGDRRSQRIEARASAVLALIEETPDMTLAEIAAHLENGHGLRVSQSTVWRFFHRRGITFKKTAHASEQQRLDVLRRRRAWFEAQPGLDPDRLVFVDETGASTKMARRRPRSRPRSERWRPARASSPSSTTTPGPRSWSARPRPSRSASTKSRARSRAAPSTGARISGSPAALPPSDATAHSRSSMAWSAPRTCRRNRKPSEKTAPGPVTERRQDRCVRDTARPAISNATMSHSLSISCCRA